jgi:putative membrane protein
LGRDLEAVVGDGVAMTVAWDSILAGLPVLIVHLSVTIVLLLAGIVFYILFAPYRELELIRQGNVAAAIVLSGQSLALTIPLAAMLAYSVSVPDIVLWGLLTLVLQFIAIVAVRLTIRHLTALIRRGDIAAALVLACAQVAVGILNAAALSG